MPEYLLGAQCLDGVEQEVGVVGWSLRNQSSIWSYRCRGWGWLSQGNPPSPSWKGDLLVALFSFPLPDGCPKALVEGFWGCIQLTKCDLLTEILHKLMQFMISEVAKLCLEMVQCFPTWVRIIRGWVGFSFLLWGWRSPPTAMIYALTWVSEGATALTVMALPHNSCLNSLKCSTMHVLCWAEQSYRFCCGVMEHTHAWVWPI